MSVMAALLLRCLIAVCVSADVGSAHAQPSRIRVVRDIASTTIGDSAEMRSSRPADGRRDSAAAALAPIVGVWQSDTVSGTSALSNCTWTPLGSAVLCEQQITSRSGRHAALNLFTVRPGGGGYELYVVGRPGDRAYQVHLSVRGAIWTYGDSAADAHGRSEVTINDFSPNGSYIWKEEVRSKGGAWRVVEQGRSRLVRRP